MQHKLKIRFEYFLTRFVAIAALFFVRYNFDGNNLPKLDPK